MWEGFHLREIHEKSATPGDASSFHSIYADGGDAWRAVLALPLRAKWSSISTPISISPSTRPTLSSAALRICDDPTESDLIENRMHHSVSRELDKPGCAK